MKNEKSTLFNRRNFVLTGLMGSVGAFSYARWIEPNQLSITRQEITIPGLPPALDGLVVAQLTDFHYEPDHLDELMAEAVQITNAAKPDIIALTGDFITNSDQVLRPLMAHLSRLKAQLGIYGIMGNHDGWHSRYSVFQHEFKRAGFDFLINDGSRINIKGESIFILGTDSIWSGQVNASKCYRGYCKGDPVIALVHEPDVFDPLTKTNHVSLQLSGHTHGGQCRVPLLGYAPVKVKYGKNYIYGAYEKGESRLFVSRGLGTVGTPVRFACPPEVAILTLKAATQSSYFRR